MRVHVRLAIAALVVVLLLAGVLASVAFAQNPYPLYGVPGYATGSCPASTGLSWYYTYCPGAPGYDQYFTPGTLGYGYGYALSYPYNYGLYGFGYSCDALPGCAPCAPASPETALPSAYPTPVPPQLTYPTPELPQLIYPTPESPQLVYPTPVPTQTVTATPTPVPPQSSGVKACSAAEPCTPPQSQYATMAWGTFGTFENWANKFRQEHCCCPTDKDVADFWASQTYSQKTGQTPFSGGFCWQ